MESLDRLIDQVTEEVSSRTPKRVISTQGLGPVNQDYLSRSRRKNLAKDKWINMPTKELSVEDKMTLDAVRLRETLNPTKFYKKKATENISKNFQIGTVIDHMDRAPRKECKQTLVDELIADAEFKKNVKKRYRKIKASNAILKKEKALAERRRAIHVKKKAKKLGSN